MISVTVTPTQEFKDRINSVYESFKELESKFKVYRKVWLQGGEVKTCGWITLHPDTPEEVSTLVDHVQSSISYNPTFMSLKYASACDVDITLDDHDMLHTYNTLTEGWDGSDYKKLVELNKKYPDGMEEEVETWKYWIDGKPVELEYYREHKVSEALKEEDGYGGSLRSLLVAFFKALWSKL